MANGPPQPPAPASDGSRSDRLDSWKDIAAYLQRDVSTVQRWEKREGMPVHRHLHEKLGTVFGYKSELDAWWGGRGMRLSQLDRPSPQASEVDPEPVALPATVPESEAATIRRRPSTRVLLLSAATLLTVAGITTLFFRAPSQDIRSLAVLPFEGVPRDPAYEYLSDGITDALISELGRIGSLRVIAYSPVMKYRGTDTPSSQIARELGVDAIVRASLARSGEQVRIEVHLMRGGPDREIWSDAFSGELRNLQTLQRAVTTAIANQVRARLTVTEQARLARTDAVNPSAHQLLLEARYLSVRTANEDNKAAIELLEKAIALDPTFAAAYAELASAYVTRLAYVTPEDTRSLQQKASAAADTAMSLDPDVPEAYLARGDLLWTNSHRFPHDRAIAEFRRALSLRPNSDQAHRRIARVLVHVGFFEEALQHADIALAINPGNWQALNTRAQSLLWTGKDEEALAILQSIPKETLVELVDANIVFALLRLGRREDAESALRRAYTKQSSDPGGNLPAIDALLLAESNPIRALELVDSVRHRKAANPSHHAAYFAGCTLARMGRGADAVRWLREASDTGFPAYALFARDPLLDPIRGDAVFQEFMAEMEKKAAALRRSLLPE